jgi:hypothetical protein
MNCISTRNKGANDPDASLHSILSAKSTNRRGINKKKIKRQDDQTNIVSKMDFQDDDDAKT